MNESVIRSPKWLRNFVDFEINTGNDIKGEPSKKIQKKIESERLKKEIEQKKAKEEKRRQEEKEESDKFHELFLISIKYIYSNYQDCKISIPDKNYLTIESTGNLGIQGIDITFKITLDNNLSTPSFSVHIKYDKKDYSYKVSGLIYMQFYNFLSTIVYQHYKTQYYKTYKSKNNYKTSPKSEDPERENKRRRYNLLKDTKEGYKRQLEKILDWEKKNPGQKHPDDKHIVKNQLDIVQNKIDLMNSLHHFESHHYSNVLSWDRI